jgi:hypothetical protein
MSELPFKAIGRWIRPMPSRLVVVAVALFGLIGLQDPIARDPFGAATITMDSGQLAALWRDERAQLVRWSRLSEQIFRLDKWSICQG